MDGQSCLEDIGAAAIGKSAKGRVDRVLQILWHYKTSQVAYRAWKSLKSRVSPAKYRLDKTPDQSRLHKDAAAALKQIAELRRPHKALQGVSDLAEGAVTALNHQAKLGLGPDGVRWDQAVKLGLSHLWRFHLHYHEYLLDLVCAKNEVEVEEGSRSDERRGKPRSGERSYGAGKRSDGSAEAGTTNEEAWELVRWKVASWMDSHRLDEARPSMDAWHPFCISRRLPAWLLMISRLEEDDPGDADGSTGRGPMLRESEDDGRSKRSSKALPSPEARPSRREGEVADNRRLAPGRSRWEGDQDAPRINQEAPPLVPPHDGKTTIESREWEENVYGQQATQSVFPGGGRSDGSAAVRLIEYGEWVDACYVQAHFLAQHLEFDLGGNHLLENVTALATAALALDESSLPDAHEPARWVDTVVNVLRKELPLQLLPHGEHFEVTHTYHCQLLGNLLMVAALCKARKLFPELEKVCLDAAKPMLDFVGRTCCPDGEIPLLGDSVCGEAWTVEEVRQMANLAGLEMPQAVEQGADTVGGYWVAAGRSDAAEGKEESPGFGEPGLHGGRSHLLFDAGQAMADILPAHGHCDMLTFVASVGGRRWFVDSGVYDYEDSTMRAYCRGSVAHNVTTIDDRNQCDIWSKFRMGYRGQVSKLNTGTTPDGFEFATATHDGYRRWGVPEVRRVMLANESSTWICLDYAQRPTGSQFTGRLHLAPGLEVQSSGPQSYVLRDDTSQRNLIFSEGVRLEIADGWYCPEFGQRFSTQVICYSAPEGSDGMGWMLTEGEGQIEVNEARALWNVQGVEGSWRK